MSGMICGQKMMLFQLEICYSENIWGVKNDFFFQMELEKRVCGLIWYSLLFLYHIDPYLSPESFYSFIYTLNQKLVTY